MLPKTRTKELMAAAMEVIAENGADITVLQMCQGLEKRGISGITPSYFNAVHNDILRNVLGRKRND